MPVIRWLAQHRIVPGLVNLYQAYGYSQSYFLYAALLDFGPFSHGSHHLANSLLLLPLIARALLGMVRLARPGWDGPRAAELYDALWLPIALQLAFDINLTSPSPDFAVFVLTIVLAGELVRLAARTDQGAGATSALLTVAVLACAATTVKLTLASDAAATLLVATALWMFRARPGPRALRPLAAMAAIIVVMLVPWLLRGVILSGYPLYPSHLAGFPVNWRAPDAKFLSIWPGSRWAGLRDWSWLVTFARQSGWNELGVELPFALALGAGVVAGAFARFGRARSRRPASAVLLVPTVAALAFWFFSSPLARFAGATFWVLAALALLLALEPVLRFAPVRLGLVATLLSPRPGCSLPTGRCCATSRSSSRRRRRCSPG